MRKILCLSLLLAGTMMVSDTFAQNSQKKKDIEIKENGDVKLEIKNGEVYIDGKKIVESETENDKDGKTVRKKIIINGKELDENEMNAFNFNFDDFGNRPMLGVSTKPSKNNDGAEVESVVPNSPAQKIGLQKGDIITRVNDKNIYTPKDLVDAINTFKPGNEIEVTYDRDNKFLTKNVVLDKKDVTTYKGIMPFNEDMFGQFDQDGNNPFLMNPYRMNPYMNNNNPKIGVSVEDRANGEGVLVQDVTENSAAQKAGIEKDDIITSFNSKQIGNVDELLDAIADAKNKESVSLDILRSGVKRQISLKIPKNLKKRDL